MEQWIELETELEDIALIKAGGGEPKQNWSSTLRFLTSTKNLKKTVVMSTIGTALTDFKNSVMWGEHLMLLIDEVHNISSPKARTFLDVNVGAALGLSATPERYGDDEELKKSINF